MRFLDMTKASLTRGATVDDMRYPRHLWSGSWRTDSEAAEEELARRRGQGFAGGEEDPDHAATRSHTPASGAGSRPRIPALFAVVVGMLIAGAFAAGTLTGKDDSTKPLPAVSSRPVNPRQGQTRTGAIYAKAVPAVVSIRTSGGSGTGFLIDDTHTIVTNAHVVDTAKHVTVRFGANGTDLDGEVLGVDASSDLAVVHLQPGSAPKSAKPLPLADSRSVQIGDSAIAIGNPFGLDRTATEGIVSGLGRRIQAPNGFEIDEAIQTDAPINPGNSGGPLLDDSGRVIGVNSQIETGGSSNGNVGIGFAVPSNTVRQVIPVLEQGKSVEHAFLGVEAAADVSGGIAPAGAEIADVTAGGPAEAAGLQPGDIITAIDGKQIDEFGQVSKIVNEHKVGDEIDVRVDRGGGERSFHVKLGTRPKTAP
jgi:putative serine protease PepD